MAHNRNIGSNRGRNTMARKPKNVQIDPLVQDIAGVVICAVAAILLVGVLAPTAGPIPQALGTLVRTTAGLGAYAVPILLVAVGIVLFTGTRHSAVASKLSGLLILFTVFVTWSQIARTPSIANLVKLKGGESNAAFYEELRNGGGLIGVTFAYVFERVLGRVCSHILLTAGTLISILLISGKPLASFGKPLASFARGFVQLLKRLMAKPKAYSERHGGEVQPEGRSEARPAIRRPPLIDIPKPEQSTSTGAGIQSGEGQPSTQGSDSEFQLPPVSILREPPPRPKRVQSELNYKIDVIERTLEEFNIEADVVEVSHGPTVTRYEIQLAPGIKVSKIVSLADNLAMALAAIDVRVEAPIPGKSAIGVEVPNSHPGIVTLRQVIDRDEFWNSPSKLTFALGEDVAGEPRYADLTKMPHMLVAGATNAGKSVCLNAMIASILFRATPKEVKFILIDPKRVELSLYDGIPHLCTPVVRDVRQATGILRAAVKEMERRYDLFVQVGTRNYDGYNEKVKLEERLPYIVIVVDELADLMMQASTEVEFCICRIAQLARATGIHLVIATQRPSVDVVTGTIKANISSRIAFATNSQVDSRTILDMGGAERLIGRGDMLFKPIDAPKPVRIQGCFISEEEIEALTKFLKGQGSPEYTLSPIKVGEQASDGLDDALNDEMYEPAVRLVVTSGYASTSMIQRRFKIGYTRAARLVDAMEEQGIVGALDGAKPREVLISREELDALFGKPSPSTGYTEPPEDKEK